MRVVEIRDDWDFANLLVTERDPPEPAPGQILLAMKAASINYRDFLMVRRGYGKYSGTLPLVPLSDGVGEVIAIGQDVTRFAVGDRVCPCFNQRWISGPFRDEYWWGLLGGPLDGVMQERLAVDERYAVKAPSHMSDLEAATLPCAALTAWSALIEAGGLKPDCTVVVLGSGGVSLFALQIAVMSGARVIATTSNEAKAEKLAALGAAEVINYRRTPDWGKAVLGLTDGVGADIVVEVGGAATIQQSIRAVRAGGTISLIGNLGGSMAEINLPLVFMKCARMIGVAVGHRDSFEAMVKAMGAANSGAGLKPVIDRKVYRFDELAAALQSLPKGEHFGKVTIDFEP